MDELGYRNQQGQRTIIMLFAGLVILLTCIGLFGLAAFSVLITLISAYLLVKWWLSGFNVRAS